MRVEDFVLVSTRRISRDYFILDLSSAKDLPQILPGQFVQVRVDNSSAAFLRRPISVYDVDYDNNIISLLIKEVGSGTRAMARLDEGCTVNLVYPLGNSFTIGSLEEHSLLVGGGVGVAPLMMLAKTLKTQSRSFRFILGYQSSEDIIESEKFSELGDLYISTEDGSYGHRGLVTEHPELRSGNYDRIYCCGPESMMKAVAGLARSGNKECEVSLENMMACGYGVCLCCVVNTSRGNVCTCTEGPVFNINELKWQI